MTPLLYLPKGLIKPGGTVVEGTAGNTGIGLAHVCRAKGYKCVIYMPNTQSQEKIDLLRMLGKSNMERISEEACFLCSLFLPPRIGTEQRSGQYSRN